MEKFDLSKAIMGQQFIFEGRAYTAMSAERNKDGMAVVKTLLGHHLSLRLLSEKAHMKPDPVERWAGIKVQGATTISSCHYPSKEKAEKELKGLGYTIVKVDEV